MKHAFALRMNLGDPVRQVSAFILQRQTLECRSPDHKEDLSYSQTRNKHRFDKQTFVILVSAIDVLGFLDNPVL